jgi:hypothetical protein
MMTLPQKVRSRSDDDCQSGPDADRLLDEASLSDDLPEDTPVVTPEERRASLRSRRRGVQFTTSLVRTGT